MNYTEETAKARVEKRGIFVGNVPRRGRVIDVSGKGTIGIKTLGAMDYLIRYHGYRRIGSLN